MEHYAASIPPSKGTLLTLGTVLLTLNEVTYGAPISEKSIKKRFLGCAESAGVDGE